MHFSLLPLSENLEFRNGKSSPERSDSGEFFVYGSNGIIGKSDQNNSSENTIIIGRVGSYCGSLYYSNIPCWVTDNAIICKSKNGDDRFWYYALLNLNLSRLSSGSGQPLINQGVLQRTVCATPLLEKRRQIASVLGALDDKIDLNRRTNETLEAMARALFRDWFVDFGPTRAKMAGQTPYLAPELWELFPNRLDDEGKPKGWTSSTVGQEVDVVGGSTPSTKNPAFWSGEIFWATPKDLSSLRNPVLLETERKITEEGLSQISSGLLPVGTVLLSSRAPIGYTAITQVPVAINQGFIAMVCQKRLSNTFIWLWTLANMETIHQKANGSTFQEISKANFRPIETIVPSSDVLRVFDEKAGFWLEKIVSNETESRTLAQLRDLLLPKLMSGEIRIRDAEKMLADAL
ncbi:restriction endonuclease subunit S [Gluconobacter sp. P5B12]|uniref:restriction endonuclease subunit S n=1 Tax=unclassified Gluconobacter TaxID=2644261 RepID=UPI001C05A1CE|nr:restriction endonuclease subunit S [Gluconobacter sp. P5B12]